MSSFLTRVFSALVCGSLFVGCGSSAAVKRVGTQAPFTRVQLINGERLPLPLMDGRRTAIMFWASWCPTSRSRIEYFDELAARYKHDPSIWFVAISVDRAGDESQYLDFIRTQKLSSTQHAYSANAELDEAYMSYGLNNIPYFYLLDANGMVVAEGSSASALF